MHRLALPVIVVADSCLHTAATVAMVLGGFCGTAAAWTGMKGFSDAGVAVAFTFALLPVLKPGSPSKPDRGWGTHPT